MRKLRERKWSVDDSRSNHIEKENSQIEIELDKIYNKDVSQRRALSIYLDNTCLINCDNIYLNMKNSKNKVTGTQTNLYDPNMNIMENDSLEINNTIKIIANEKDVRYGSPAIWLKNLKRNSEIKYKNSNLFSATNNTRAKFKSVRNDKERKIDEIQEIEILPNLKKVKKDSIKHFNIEKNSNCPIKLKLKILNENNLVGKNNREKKISLLAKNQSLINLDKNINSTLNEFNFNLNLGNNQKNFKTLISNSKIMTRNKEKRFSNINQGVSKIMSTTYKGTEIDEIINTSSYLDNSKILLIKEKKVENNNFYLKNKIRKLKSIVYPSERSSNYIENDLRKSKTNPNSKNSSPQIMKYYKEKIFNIGSNWISNSNSDKINLCNTGSKPDSNTNSDKANLCNMGSNTNSNSEKANLCNIGSNTTSNSDSDLKEKLDKNENSLENIQENFSQSKSQPNFKTSTSESISMFKTIDQKIQIDAYLHRTFKGKINWKAGEIIAEGSSAVVYKALNEDEGYIFVVKKYNNIGDPKLLELFQNEVNIFKQLDHPNIIKFIGSDIIENNLLIYLEYISGGSIKYILDKYGPLNENITKIYLKQIIDGLEYLHSKHIVHRDIKCANILLDVKGGIKLSDFGCSGQFKEIDISVNSGEFLDSLKGTLPWMAPEVVCQNKYGKSADIWSLGCTLLEIATGQTPWGKLDNCYQAMTKIGRSNDIPPIPDYLSENFKDLLLKCLNRNPKERATFKDLRDHPFLK